MTNSVTVKRERTFRVTPKTVYVVSESSSESGYLYFSGSSNAELAICDSEEQAKAVMAALAAAATR